MLCEDAPTSCLMCTFGLRCLPGFDLEVVAVFPVQQVVIMRLVADVFQTASVLISRDEWDCRLPCTNSYKWSPVCLLHCCWCPLRKTMRGMGVCENAYSFLFYFILFYLRLFWWSYMRGLAATGPHSLRGNIFVSLNVNHRKCFWFACTARSDCARWLVSCFLNLFCFCFFFYFLACHCDTWWYWCRFSCVHGFLTVPTYLQPPPSLPPSPLVQHQAKTRAEPGRVWRVLSLPYSWAFSSTSGNSLPQQPECFHIRDVPVFYLLIFSVCCVEICLFFCLWLLAATLYGPESPGHAVIFTGSLQSHLVREITAVVYPGSVWEWTFPYEHFDLNLGWISTHTWPMCRIWRNRCCT